jgi:hypothetical protein
MRTERCIAATLASSATVTGSMSVIITTTLQNNAPITWAAIQGYFTLYFGPESPGEADYNGGAAEFA